MWHGFLNLALWQAFNWLPLCFGVWLVFIRNYYRLLESIQSNIIILNQDKFFLDWSIFDVFPFLMIIQKISYSLLEFCQYRKIYISYKDVKHVGKGNFIIFLTLRYASFRNQKKTWWLKTYESLCGGFALHVIKLKRRN